MKRKKTMKGVSERNGKFRCYIPTGTSGKKQWLDSHDTPEAALAQKESVLKHMARGMVRPADLKDRSLAGVAASARIHKEKFDQAREGYLRWWDSHWSSIEKTLVEMHISPDKGLHEFTAEIWKRFAKHREVSVSPSTIAAHFRLLSLIYGYAMTQGVQDWSPLGAVKIKAGRPKRTYFLSEDSVYDLVDRIEAESGSAHARTDAALVGFLYLTGLRRSEVNRIELSDIDLAQGKIWIDGKRRDEFIGISESCAEFVETLVAASRNYVPDGRARGIAKRGGKFLMWNISYITKAFDRIKKFDGQLHPHALRHSYCTEIVKAMKTAGKSDQEILQITRIKSLQTLAIYVHLTADRSDVNLIGRGRRRKLRRVE